MVVNVICFILGAFLGALFTYAHALDRERGFRADMEGLARRNEKLRDRLKRAQIKLAEDEETATGDDAIGIEKDPFEGIEK